MAPLTFEKETDVTLPLPEGGKEEEIKPPQKRRGRPPGSTSRASLESLEAKLTERLLEDMLIPAALFSPLLAANIEARAERTSKAVVRIAAKNPRVRTGLEKALDGSDILTIAMFGLTCAVCVMVDMSMMSPESIPARAAGVPKLWDETYDEPMTQQNGSGSYHRGLLAETEVA